jgi:hypothetical protein
MGSQSGLLASPSIRLKGERIVKQGVFSFSVEF